jgi:hypothetical protein
MVIDSQTLIDFRVFHAAMMTGVGWVFKCIPRYCENPWSIAVKPAPMLV